MEKMLLEHPAEVIVMLIFVIPILQGLVKIILGKLGDDGSGCEVKHKALIDQVCPKLEDIKKRIEKLDNRQIHNTQQLSRIIHTQQEEIVALKTRVKQLEKESDFNRSRG
jgi:hypothetical protein